MRFRLLAAVTLSSACATAPAEIQKPYSSRPHPPVVLGEVIFENDPSVCDALASQEIIHIEDPLLQEAFDFLQTHSPSFAADLERFQDRGLVSVRIGFADDFDDTYSDVPAGASNVAGVFAGGRYTGVDFIQPGHVVCNLDVVFFIAKDVEAAVAAGMSRDEIRDDLAVILAHEFYGHVIPYGLQEEIRWPIPCGDIDSDTAPESIGCAGDRENVVRRETDVPPRTRYRSGQIDVGLLCVRSPERCTEPAPTFPTSRRF